MAEINYEELFGITLSEEPEVANPEDDEELEGENEPETEVGDTEDADPDELTEEDDGEAPEEDEPKEKGGQSKEDNARFAAARRKAEQERDAAIEKARADAQAEMDALIRRMGLTDPTGKPITTKAEYDRYQAANAEQKAEEARRRVGMEKAEWDQMVNNLPNVQEALQQAERARQSEQLRQKEAAQQAVNAEIAEIGKMDPAIQTLQDLAKVPEYGEIVRKVQGGMSLLDAYKLATYDSRMQTREAARQNAINNARSKNHLTKTTERGTGDERVPSDVKAAYRMFNPDMTDEEIHKHYNRDRKNVKR